MDSLALWSLVFEMVEVECFLKNEWSNYQVIQPTYDT